MQSAGFRVSEIVGRSRDGGRHFDRLDVDFAALIAEVHRTGCHREQRVVLGALYIGTGVPFRAALKDDDRANCDALACVLLNASALGVRIATVANRALALFMCHN